MSIESGVLKLFLETSGLQPSLLPCHYLSSNDLAVPFVIIPMKSSNLQKLQNSLDESHIVNIFQTVDLFVSKLPKGMQHQENVFGVFRGLAFWLYPVMAVKFIGAEVLGADDWTQQYTIQHSIFDDITAIIELLNILNLKRFISQAIQKYVK